jgi:hypothetical protein
MKILMILGLAALLGQSGCSTNRHLLEPEFDKRQEVSPELPTHRACSSGPNCDCGGCRVSGSCECRHAPDSNARPPIRVIP